MLIKYKLKPFSVYLFFCTLCWQIPVKVVFANTVDNTNNLPSNKMELYLELIVNERPVNHIAAVDYDKPDFYILPQDLATTGIDPKHWQQLTPRNDGKIALNQIKNLLVTYRQERQQLLILAPPAWLPNQTLSLGSSQAYYPAQNSNGALFNYDAYISRPKHGDDYASMWTDLRVFTDYGSFSSTGTYNHPFNKKAKRYIRYDTYWQSSDQESMLTIDAGDLVTRSVSWSDPIRLGGIQLSKNFSIRPDIITYPLPELAGESSLPSTVDLLVNGYNIESSSVNAGPFTLTNIPYINGAGEATIVTTDALGRQVSTTVSLYVTSSLLKQGLADYSFSTGFIRQKYGIDNFRYNQLAVNGNYRYGLTDYFTADSHIEAAKDLQQFGVGGTLRLGILGVVNGSYSQSYYGSRDGQKMTVGYQYNNRIFSIAAQYSDTKKDFYGLPNLEYGNQTSNTNTQITFGLPLGDAGNLAAGYFKIKSHGQSASELVNISWNRSFQQIGSLFFSVSKSNRDNRWTGFLQWMIPFGQSEDSLSINANRDSQGQYSQRVNYNRNLPYSGGWGWNLGYQNNSRQDNYYQGDLSWRNQSVQLRGGTYGTNKDNTWWGDAQGSLIFIDNQFYLANEVQDSFVAISTDNIADVDIYYENTFAGTTNDKGYLLLTKVPAYYAAKYAIDPVTLRENVHVDNFEQRVAVKSKNGYILDFGLKPITPSYLTLVDEQNNTLPLGSLVTLNGVQAGYVGWDGFVYFDSINADNQINVISPESAQYNCKFSSSDLQNSDGNAPQKLACHQEEKL